MGLTAEIAPLPPGLYAAAVELWRETGVTRPWNDPEADLRRAIDGPSSTILAAANGERLLATAMVGHDGHRGWIYYLAVKPDLQRSGLGRALMHAAEAWLLKRGVPKVNLMVRRDNTQATGFYTAIGYSENDVIVFNRRLIDDEVRQ